MNFTSAFRYVWVELADPRTRDWLLVSPPWMIPAVTVVYLYFVLEYGPQYMSNHSPYALTTFIKCYDLFQIVANSVFMYSIITVLKHMDASFFCDPIVYSYDPESYKLAETMWWILLLKIVDYTETIIFVLRKKKNHVSLVHIYHHISTVFLQWYMTRYFSGVMSSFVHAVNCSTHIAMYLYYFLSCFGPKVRNYANKLKSLIAAMQTVQFWGLMMYCLQALCFNCDIPKTPVVLVLLDLAVNLVLLYNFYHANYSPKAKTHIIQV